MSGPHTEDPRLPVPDREQIDRYEAEMAELQAARDERIRQATERERREQ